MPIRLTVLGPAAAGAEEIRLNHAFAGPDGMRRLVEANGRPASDTIRKASIVDRAQRADVTLQLPLSCDLEAAVAELSSEVADVRGPVVSMSPPDGGAPATVRACAGDPVAGTPA